MAGLYELDNLLSYPHLPLPPQLRLRGHELPAGRGADPAAHLQYVTRDMLYVTCYVLHLRVEAVVQGQVGCGGGVAEGGQVQVEGGAPAGGEGGEAGLGHQHGEGRHREHWHALTQWRGVTVVKLITAARGDTYLVAEMTTDFDNVLRGLQRVQLLRPLADAEADPHHDPPQRGDPRQHPLLQHPPARRRLAADEGVKLTHIVPQARLAALRIKYLFNYL